MPEPRGMHPAVAQADPALPAWHDASLRTVRAPPEALHPPAAAQAVALTPWRSVRRQGARGWSVTPPRRHRPTAEAAPSATPRGPPSSTHWWAPITRMSPPRCAGACFLPHRLRAAFGARGVAIRDHRIQRLVQIGHGERVGRNRHRRRRWASYTRPQRTRTTVCLEAV